MIARNDVEAPFHDAPGWNMRLRLVLVLQPICGFSVCLSFATNHNLRLRVSGPSSRRAGALTQGEAQRMLPVPPALTLFRWPDRGRQGHV